MNQSSNPEWFVAVVPRPEATRVVFGVPHAGGGCASMADLSAALPSHVELSTLSLPGRQARFGEPTRTDLDGLVLEIADAVSSYDERPFELFGYCSGALLAYLVADRLIAAGGRKPERLSVASYPSPDVVRPPKSLHGLESAEFWQKMEELGGVPVALLESPVFRPLVEPALRADFALYAGYEASSRPPLEIPVRLLTGTRDRIVAPAAAAGWSEMTTAGFEAVHLDSGHWLLDEAPAELAEELGRL